MHVAYFGFAFDIWIIWFNMDKLQLDLNILHSRGDEGEASSPQGIADPICIFDNEYLNPISDFKGNLCLI